MKHVLSASRTFRGLGGGLRTGIRGLCTNPNQVKVVTPPGAAPPVTPSVLPPPYKPRFKMRYALLALSPLAAYGYWSYNCYQETLAESEYLVSTNFRESREVIRRSKLTSKVVSRLILEAQQECPDEWVNPEEFGRFVKVASGSVYFDVWDILGLLRNSPMKGGKVELKECLVGLAMLVETDEPSVRLELAWDAVNFDKEGSLALHEFSDLLERMERTGHIMNSSLIRRMGYFPPVYGILDGKGVAQEFYKKLGRSEGMGIKIDEFISIAEQKKFAKVIDFWYFDKMRHRLDKRTADKMKLLHGDESVKKSISEENEEKGDVEMEVAVEEKEKAGDHSE